MAHGLVHDVDRLERLESLVASLEQRLALLETRTGTVLADTAPPYAAGAAIPAAATQDGGLDTKDVLSLVGRTFIVFGGAFLLRALTDSGRLPQAGGIALGLLYAFGGIVAAARAGARAQRLSAAFHGFTAVAIGLPIVWEAAIRFGLISPSTAALGVGLLTAIGLLVAWRFRIQSLAGFATMATLAILPALVIATAEGIAPATFVLIALGLATLWLGYDCDWKWMRWFAAFVADIAVVEITTRALRPEQPEPAGIVMALQLLLLGGYLAMITTRTLVKGRLVIPFEVVQTLAVLLVGLGGAVTVAQRVGTGDVALGLAGVALGAGAYGAAFAFVDRRQGLGENFYFYATLALVLTLTGLAVILPRPVLVVVLAALAVVSSAMAARTTRLALVMHSGVYAVVAASASGLLATALAAFVGVPAGAWPSVGVLSWVVVLACLLALAFPAPVRASGGTSLLTTGPRTVQAIILVSGLGAALIMTAAPLLAGTPPHPGPLGTLRTAVLALSAIVLAVSSRHERGGDLARLLYPALGLAAIKLVAEDFRQAEASLLFVSLALFGIALVAAPRLVRRAPAAS